MAKDKVVIAVIVTIVLSAMLFGTFMAYKTYKSPMYVEDINHVIEMLKSESKDENLRMIRLSIFNELSRSYKMIDRKTNEIRKFTKTEMTEIYEFIGGKEAVMHYLRNITDEYEKKKEIQFARKELKIINDDDVLELLYK